MEFSNKLLLSLKQDLKVLNTTSEEIIKKLPFFELNSWLFPSKSHQEVSEIHLQNFSKNKQYLGYLELIIDRLYLLINLIIKYAETFLNVAERSKPKNVTRPNNLSLGASTDLLWKKVTDLNDIITINRERSLKEDSRLNISNRGTQTTTYSSNTCSSCATAISCIKELISELEIHVDTVCVKKIRKDLQEDIYDITQSGCMNRLTLAIIEDVKNFVGRLQTIEKENKQCSSKLADLTIKYGESLKINKNLESFLKKLQKRSRNVKLKKKELSKKLNELVQINQNNEYKLVQERTKIKILEKSVQESTVSLALLSTDNEKLHQEIGKTLSENVDISTEKDMWKSRFSETYLENRDLKNKLEEFESEMKSLKKGMEKINQNCEKLTASLEQCNLKIIQKKEKFEHFLKSLMNIANANRKKDADAVMKFKKAFQITGDPIADMRRQVEINKFNIKALEQHNNDLLGTIHRVQEKIIPIKYS